jgi:hypothetical protein
MFIHEQSRIEAYGAARNESMKMHVKATNCIVVYNNNREFLPATQIIEQPFL